MRVALLLLCVGCAAAVTPVQKVITLLEEMLTKGKQEKQEEQVQFAAYKQFCDDTAGEKKRLVTEAEEAIDMLKADISKATSDVAQLGKEITGLDSDIAVWTGDVKAATKVRALEKTDYDTTHKDYTESLDALDRAIQVLKKQSHDRKQAGGASLAEVSKLKSLQLIPAAAKKAIDTFLMQDPEEEGLAVSAPEAEGYEFQSHGIIEILEKLKDKFIDERTTLEKEEQNTRHAFQLLASDLNAQIAQANLDRGEKATNKAKSLQSKADAKGDLTDTSATMAEDKKYLSDLVSTCQTKAGDFESRQRLRGEEIEAIEKAINIISDQVSGKAEKHLPAALMQKKHTALAQLRSETVNPAQQRVADLLRVRASELNSRVLATVATAALDDPFGKVRKLIKDLIVRLMEEANEEAEHKGWCDTELSTNEQTRKEKTEAVETLHAEIDELNSSIAKLHEDIGDLSTAVADLDAAMSKATQIRQEEKETNTATIKDASEAQTAVAQALVVLKEFYAKAAESTSLVQKKRQGQPEVFDTEFKGMQGESSGVIGMLEIIESDFARLETDTEGTEQNSQRQYDEFMTDSKVDKAQKSKDVEHKSAKRQDQEQGLVVKTQDLDGTQKELDAALTYYDKLKPSCVDAGVSYEDRVSRRKEEIESLQEALKILNGEEIA